MIKKIILLSCLSVGLNHFVNASDIHSYVFLPSVTIEGKVSDAIEIRTEETSFPAVYSVKEQAFSPLTIPFEVVSLNGVALDYKLTLPMSVHQCATSGEFDVDVQLDNEVWPKEGVVFNGALKKHFMTLTYASVPQVKGASQDCFGTLRVQVEVVTL